jgi:heme/copper-type cytochrome/quinol oxidase subunit 2
MNGSGWPVLGAAFLVATLLLGGGYVVLQTYAPPASATAPVTPEIRQFTVSLHAFQSGERTLRHWIPSTIVVNAGDTVILRVANADTESAHGFSLGALNVSVAAIAPGEAVTVRFRAIRPGVYQFGCTLEVAGVRGRRDPVGPCDLRSR